MTIWADAWRIADLAVPLPPGRARAGASGEAGRWQRSFETPVATSEAARAWDGWASAAGLGGPWRRPDVQIAFGLPPGREGVALRDEDEHRR